MEKVNILGVDVNSVTMAQALAVVSAWTVENDGHKHYIVTPNIEFLIAAKKDAQFRQILNQADLSLPDSSRFGWVLEQTTTKNHLLKFLGWWLFPFGKTITGLKFPVVTGVDFMDQLCAVAAQKGWRIGLLGGVGEAAAQTARALQSKYPQLKITFAQSGGQVDPEGNMIDSQFQLPESDIIFVAFGHGKQERWIVQNMSKINAKVFMGVGGSFDYLSGSVVRAPKLLRKLGLEWLFRLAIQPWRIKRQLQLVKFVFQI